MNLAVTNTLIIIKMGIILNIRPTKILIVQDIDKYCSDIYFVCMMMSFVNAPRLFSTLVFGQLLYTVQVQIFIAHLGFCVLLLFFVVE